jgi:cyclopropane fatty-acyl-phospholipid synthase-like methyltransferase
MNYRVMSEKNSKFKETAKEIIDKYNKEVEMNYVVYYNWFDWKFKVSRLRKILV